MRRDVLAVVLAAVVSTGCATSESPILEVDAAPQDAPATIDAVVMDTPTTQVNCGAVTQCGTCTSLGPCGWCGASNSCVAGAAAGPSVGACAGGWSFSPTTCPAVDASAPDVTTAPDVTATPDVTTSPDVTTTPDATTAVDAAADPCASSTTCGTCTAQASCGFCQTTGRCQTGNRDAPTVGPACPSGWAWVSTSCTTTVPDGGTSMDTCGSATTCGTCTQQSQCGWCPGLNRCLLGTGTGPNTMAATCGTWAWYSGQCGGDAGATDAGAATDASDPCVSATTCSACTARSQCGWCPGANRCLVGTTTGPSGTVAACGAWAWLSSACTTADAGTTDAGVTNTIPGFGNPTTFNASEVARACPAGGTLRLQVARIYATPRAPSGSPWDGIPGVTDFLCSAASDRIRTALRDQINNTRMGVGDLIDRLVGDRFREVVSTQCGTAADWFLGRWEGPDMYGSMYSPATATTARWRTTTENDSWEAPRAGAVWANAYVDVACSSLGASQFRLEVRDDDVIGSDLVGNLTFRANEVSPRAICTGYAFREGVEGIAGALFRATVTGATQNCTGLR